jgi:YteA family regulatory protein
MDYIKLKFFKRLLENEKYKLLSRIRFINENGLAMSMKDSTGELSMCDNNSGDTGSELFERSKDFALREDAVLVIKAIDCALDKIKDGSYGKCDLCGKAIPLERLEAVPYTAVCFDCRVMVEQAPNPSARPVEEEVLNDLYLQGRREDVERAGYSMEDTWEDLSSY